MAETGTGNLNLADWASRDESGKTAKVAEVLNKTNRVLDDMVWIEANDATVHTTTIRSDLPSGTWRLMNYGVQPTKSRTVQVQDSMGELTAYSEIDKKICMLNGNTAEFRLSEETPFIEGLTQDFLTALFYGNTDSDPEQFMGIAPRYDVAADTNVIIGSGDGTDNTSIYLVTWGVNTTHGIFPKGSQAGLQVRDLGEVTLQDDRTPAGLYQGYRSMYSWDCGLCVRDWRYNVRIANIDKGDLTKDAGDGSDDLIDLMIQSLYKLPNPAVNGKVFYVSRTVASFLDRQTLNHSNVYLKYGLDVHGREILTFRGIPVHLVDAIEDDEALVS